MSSIEPNNGSREIDGCQEGSGALIVARGHGAERFELGDEVFNPVPRVVSILLRRMWSVAMGLGREHDGFPSRLTRGAPPCSRILCLVGHDRLRVQRLHERLRPGQIRDLSWRELDAEGMAQSSAGGVDCCGPSACAAPDRCVRLGPPGAPALG